MLNQDSHEGGFTLIEMLIVILIISILLLIAVPNMAKNNEVVKQKSCKATIQLIQSQVGAYQVEHGELPVDLAILKDEKYITTDQCENENDLTLVDGTVYKTDEMP